jgi:hypothetical protein
MATTILRHGTSPIIVAAATFKIPQRKILKLGSVKYCSRVFCPPLFNTNLNLERSCGGFIPIAIGMAFCKNQIFQV